MAVVMMAMVAKTSYATIDIDISRSRIIITDPHTIKLGNVTVSGYSGTYWVEFRWDPERLVFVPIDGGVETAGAGNVWSITDTTTDGTMEITVGIDLENRLISLSFRGLSGYSRVDIGYITIQQGIDEFDIYNNGAWFLNHMGSIDAVCGELSSQFQAVHFGYNQWDGLGVNLGPNQTRSGTIRCLPAWFDLNSPFILYYGVSAYSLQ